jgi:hypothetical protein
MGMTERCPRLPHAECRKDISSAGTLGVSATTQRFQSRTIGEKQAGPHVQSTNSRGQDAGDGPVRD